MLAEGPEDRMEPRSKASESPRELRACEYFDGTGLTIRIFTELHLEQGAGVAGQVLGSMISRLSLSLLLTKRLGFLDDGILTWNACLNHTTAALSANTEKLIQAPKHFQALV